MVEEDAPHPMEEKLDEERRAHQEYRSATDGHLARLEAKLDELEAQQEKDKLFRATVSEALRGLSDDVLRSRDGEEPEFSRKYVEGFDRHVDEKKEEEEEEFRAANNTAPRFPLEEEFSDMEQPSDDEVLHRQRFAGVETGEERTSKNDHETASRGPFGQSSELTDDKNLDP